MKLVYLVAIALGAVYVLNPGAGILELIPDNLPVVGNLDEAGAIGLIIWGVRKLRSKKPVEYSSAGDRPHPFD